MDAPPALAITALEAQERDHERRKPRSAQRPAYAHRLHAARLQRLEREVAELRMERGVLKRSVVLWVKETTALGQPLSPLSGTTPVLQQRTTDRTRAPQATTKRHYTDSGGRPGPLRSIDDIFEGTEQIQQLVIARAISGLRIE